MYPPSFAVDITLGSTTQETTMHSKIKLAFGYLWVISASIVFLAVVQSLSVGGPSGAVVIGYVVVFAYVILRWNLVVERMAIENKWLFLLLRGFVLLCALVIFAGVSAFHGGSEEGKIFAAIVAVAMAVEAGRQVKRISLQPN